MAELAVFDKDPNIYLFTSLTAGSSHIITATSRIETILRANKIPFIGLDTATHELGKKLFQRRAAGKKLPLLVKEGYVLGGIEEIEEWNEYDELHEALGVDTAFTAYPPKPTSLFEPAPSKTPPPLAGALPGGFSFGQSGDSPFASLGAVGGSKAKENKPIASAEQNLAIRQMGAEAAKIAASKKPTPVKISTTNPLMTEKTNAKSPADVLSPKSTPLPKSPGTATTEKEEGKAKNTGLPDLLSPRSIPLPQTPGAVPKLEQQKPVHAPPSMHDDAENSALSAGPIQETQAKEDSDEEDSSEDSIAEKTADKTQAQDPKEVSKADASVKQGGQDEESSEDESSEEESEEEESEEEAKTKPAEANPVETKPTTLAPQLKQHSSESSTMENKPEKTQDQDPKDASRAGASVEEGEEEGSSEEESEDEAEADEADKKEEVKSVEAKATTIVAQPKQSSSEETSEEEDDESEEEVETVETKKNEVKKTQTQDAKDASKASESVLD